MAHNIDSSKSRSETRIMNGRRIITSGVKEITGDNVIDVLQKTMLEHELNRSEIDYLYRYYKGDQPVRYREKTVRPEICIRLLIWKGMQ